MSAEMQVRASNEVQTFSCWLVKASRASLASLHTAPCDMVVRNQTAPICFDQGVSQIVLHGLSVELPLSCWCLGS